MTFGAPMVLHAADADSLFQRLRMLEAAAEATGGGAEGRAVLQFHNYVNNADAVSGQGPDVRLLGCRACNVCMYIIQDTCSLERQ